MDLHSLKNKFEDQLWVLENNIDFEYKDLIKMDPITRKEKQELIKERNEILEQIKLLDTFNCRKYKFNENRYQKYKHLNNEELVITAVKAKKEAEFAGGPAYVKSIEEYEGMREEFGWRIQNNIDVIKNTRYYKDCNINELYVETDPAIYDDLINLCFDNYEPAKEYEDFYNLLKEGKGIFKYYCIKFEDELVGGIIFDSMFVIRALVIKDTFRCCGLGTKLINKVYNEAKIKGKEIKLYAIPSKTFYFLIKNDFLKETNEKVLNFEIYTTETKRQKEIKDEDYENIIIS